MGVMWYAHLLPGPVISGVTAPWETAVMAGSVPSHWSLRLHLGNLSWGLGNSNISHLLIKITALTHFRQVDDHEVE